MNSVETRAKRLEQLYAEGQQAAKDAPGTNGGRLLMQKGEGPSAEYWLADDDDKALGPMLGSNKTIVAHLTRSGIGGFTGGDGNCIDLTDGTVSRSALQRRDERLAGRA